MGVTAIIMGSQANVCVTPYSYSKARVAAKEDSFEQMKVGSFANNAEDEDAKQGTTIGWYSAPTSVKGTKTTWIEEDPMNCITECQMNCTAAYTEQMLLLKSSGEGGCGECLYHCTHPWGKNIETCHTSAECTTAVEKHRGIVNFCQPVAMCFQMCAGRGYTEIDKRAIPMGGPATVAVGPVQWNKDPKPHDEASKDPLPLWTTAGYDSNEVDRWGPKGRKLRCLLECEYDGKLAVGFGITAVCMVLMAPFFMIIGATKELKSIPFLILGILFWAASLILATDAFLVNMRRKQGMGWEIWAYENAPAYQIISPGRNNRIVVTANWMMHVIFGFGLLANMFTLLAWYDREEIWNRRKAPPPRAQERPPSPARDEKPAIKPMSYYGEDLARQEEMMSGGTAGPFEEGARANQYDVDIGIKWASEPAPAGNNVMEIVIKEVVPGGAADQASNSGLNGKNAPAPGDVVLLIGNVPAGGEEPEMINVYGKPYSETLDMIRSQPAGTKIRFMFARHSAYMKYQFDIVRQPRGGNVQGGNFGSATAAELFERFEIEEEAGAAVHLA
eukprot:GHVU01164239.1.p1 GENE.GHVU01164239.1~~GHVU01164239.1.p1  ORF type:complete len:594 (+),score=79.63 GHVU01164239.1:106-1782(+)